MIRSLHTKILDDRGNTGIAVIVAAPFLLAFMLILVSALQYFEATRQAQAISSEAARIGAQPEQNSVRVDTFSSAAWTISDDSRREAEEYVEKYDGAKLVSLEKSTETPFAAKSVVTIDVDYIFDVPGLPAAAEVDSTAQVLRGVEEGI